MHTDMTAVTIQSNKIVSTEVQDNWALLQPPYRRKQMNFLANPVHFLKISPSLSPAHRDGEYRPRPC